MHSLPADTKYFPISWDLLPSHNSPAPNNHQSPSSNYGLDFRFSMLSLAVSLLFFGAMLFNCITDVNGIRGECLGPPFLYMTSHGGVDEINEVLKYSRNGCPLGLATKSDNATPLQVRGMVFDGDEMLVANGAKDESIIWKYSACKSAGVRMNEGVFISALSSDNSGLAHPYDMVFDDTYMYVSNQNSCLVTRYLRKDGSPQTLPELAKHGALDGAFADFSKDSLRGISMDNAGRLFVANREGDSMVMLNSTDGPVLDSRDEDNPIGVFYSASRGSVFVGSSTKDLVQELSVPSLDVLQTYRHKDLKHPAGIVVYSPGNGVADIMYVVSQDKDKLLAFELLTGGIADMEKLVEGDNFSKNWKHVETVADLEGLAGENLVLSSC